MRTSKFAFILFIIILFSNNLFSQNKVGLKGGANLASQTGFFNSSKQNPSKSIFGYQFGIFYKYKIDNHWTFSTELNYSLIGSEVFLVTEEQILQPENNHYYKNRIGYIEIPVTFQYSFGKFYLGAGPAIAVKIFSKLSDFEGREFKTHNYKTLDASANILAGIEVYKNWDVNVRYSYGFLNVMKGNNSINTNNSFYNLSILYTLK